MEKREQRLKQVFKAQIDNLREACYVLFGYRMDLTSEATAAAGTGIIPTTFRLTPQVNSHWHRPSHTHRPHHGFCYPRERGLTLVGALRYHTVPPQQITPSLTCIVCHAAWR